MTIFREKYGPWALIAGGSEGIGFAYAERLAAEGCNLILLGRRQQALDEAAQRLSSVEVETHAVDLTRPIDRDWLTALVERREIGLLIYNAGATHGAELFLDAPLDNALNLVALNCSGPLTFCHVLGDKMRSRGRGGILLMSSMSGLAGGAYIAGYCASKAFDITLAEALWQELRVEGIDVVCVVAGATRTPAMARSGIDLDNNDAVRDADEVARDGLAALANGPVFVADELKPFADILRGNDRRQASEGMSRGAASMYDKPFPPKPGRH